MEAHDRTNGLGSQGPQGSRLRHVQGVSGIQELQLLQYLLQEPMAFRWQTDVWTTKRIADSIERKFAISYHYAHVSRIMHALEWSPQKPEQRALQRNEAVIQEWKTTNWKRIKKTPRGWAPTLFLSMNWVSCSPTMKRGAMPKSQ